MFFIANDMGSYRHRPLTTLEDGTTQDVKNVPTRHDTRTKTGIVMLSHWTYDATHLGYRPTLVEHHLDGPELKIPIISLRYFLTHIELLTEEPF